MSENKMIVYHNNGNIRYEGEMKNGVFNGEGNSYHENGKREYSGKFKDGKFHGKGNYYRADGSLMYRGDFKEGVFYPDYDNAPLKYKGSYVNGRFDGYGILYYEDKKTIMYEGEFKNGKFNGKGKSYDKNSELMYEGIFKDNHYIFETEGTRDLKAPLTLSCINPDSTLYSTFQSHNRKTLTNDHGFFAGYMKSRNTEYTAQEICLIRSIDTTDNFTECFSITKPTNPPCLEKGKNNRIYFSYPDFSDNNSYVLVFDEGDYSKPVSCKTILKSAAGKVCMAFDPVNELLYYFSNNSRFTVMDKDANIIRSFLLTVPGKNAKVEYPQLYIDAKGTVHAAWTTENPSKPYLYWSIHYLRSKDQAQSWERADKTIVVSPVIADDTGESTLIVDKDELDLQTWLHNFTVKDGKIHFVYSPHFDDPNKLYGSLFNAYMHYVRYDLETGKKDHEILPKLKGNKINILGFDGFFAHDMKKPGSPLYLISRQNLRIACLLSKDNGITWEDHALSDELENSIYSISGSGTITDDGYVKGIFTDYVRDDNYSDLFAPAKTWYFKIKA